MNKNEVEPAIRRDFPKEARKLLVTVHPVEKTTILSLTVENLLPDSGAARIFYILGYRSKKLIQINIVWLGNGHHWERDRAIIDTANSLRDYFLADGFAKDRMIANRKLANGAILVFRGSDSRGHMVLLVLHGGEVGRDHRKRPKPPALRLELSYIEDPTHPDVYRIGKGKF